MKQSELLRWLQRQGVEVKAGSNHLKLYYNGKQSTLSKHKGQEIPKPTEIAIKKQLGLI
ncbi:mRNA interferase [Pasteurellaceae bacterium Macca]|nr:mRNA interferase [Pasteurellaceae bacterium Macca]MCK3656243.1 mRNA interferase [Pasteurellaceae bacterium Macca]MCK3656523.1 mRNA interferase [Pasteurellaceae bacterium Macca]